VVLHHGPRVGLDWHAGVCSSGSDPVTGSALHRQFGGEQNTVFLLAGAGQRIGPWRMELKAADSHLGPGAYRRQTLVQAGLSLAFTPDGM